MKSAAQIRLDIGATYQELIDNNAKAEALRKRLGTALAEARDHPELTIEEGRKIPPQPIPRQTAVRLMKLAP